MLKFEVLFPARKKIQPYKVDKFGYYMGDIFGYGKKDQHFLTYSLVLIVTIFCFFFLRLFDVIESLNAGVISLNSKFISEEILTIFRTSCTLLAFYTIFILMIFDKEGGNMNPLFHKERITRSHKTMGLERMVPFSSWTLIVFGIYFLSVSILGWIELFDSNLPKFLVLSSGMLLPMALGMSMLTATVVTYVIIPEEVKSRLFQPFATSGKKGGTGLGLAMVKQIAEEHHGKVTYKSSPEGTKFSLVIPLETV